MSELIERLRDGLPGEMEGSGLHLVDYYDAEALFTEAADELTALCTQVSQLTAGLEVAVGALKPFAQALDDWGDEPGQDDKRNLWEHPAAIGIGLGNLRKARAAITSLLGEG